MTAPIIDGHVVVTTLAGRASLTVHQHAGPFCLPVLSLILEPAQVLSLADQLTQAAVPPPPVVRRRIQVRPASAAGTWAVRCPECFEVPGLWWQHEAAMTAALAHLRSEHASEVSR